MSRRQVVTFVVVALVAVPLMLLRLAPAVCAECQPQVAELTDSHCGGTESGRAELPTDKCPTSSIGCCLELLGPHRTLDAPPPESQADLPGAEVPQVSEAIDPAASLSAISNGPPPLHGFPPLFRLHAALLI